MFYTTKNEITPMSNCVSTQMNKNRSKNTRPKKEAGIDAKCTICYYFAVSFMRFISMFTIMFIAFIEAFLTF